MLHEEWSTFDLVFVEIRAHRNATPRNGRVVSVGTRAHRTLHEEGCSDFWAVVPFGKPDEG